jgi:DME family drug/metabolite transporter
MSTSRLMRAEVFAVIAAALNGSIGSLTRWGFHGGASHDQVAFWKCFLAFLALLIFCLVNSAQRIVVLSLRSRWKGFLILSFFGVFCLYFFETWAFQEASIPLVSFLTYAAGGATIILSSIFLKEEIGFYKITAFVAIITGVYLIFVFEGGMEGSHLGICLALLGGLGYAIFIFSSKLLGVGGGVAQLVWLFGFGSLYLAVPIIRGGIQVPPVAALGTILALVIFPTIGGFYFTTKAIEAGEASRVQVIETSDPLFSTLFALVIFGDKLGLIGSLGAACIMVGLLLALRREGGSTRQVERSG